MNKKKKNPPLHFFVAVRNNKVQEALQKEGFVFTLVLLFYSLRNQQGAKFNVNYISVATVLGAQRLFAAPLSFRQIISLIIPKPCSQNLLLVMKIRPSPLTHPPLFKCGTSPTVLSPIGGAS